MVSSFVTRVLEAKGLSYRSSIPEVSQSPKSSLLLLIASVLDSLEKLRTSLVDEKGEPISLVLEVTGRSS